MKTYYEAAPDLESSTDDYATRFDGAVGRWFLEVQEKATLAHLNGITNATILDVGGGHGQSIEALLKSGHTVTVTGSAQACSHRLQAFLSDDNASFVVCPLAELPFDDAHFDAVISYRMMTHLEDWRGLICELTRVSRNRVIIDYPTQRSFNCLNEFLFRWKKGVERNTRHYHVFREREIIMAFESQGYKLRSRCGQFVLPMALHRAHKVKAVAATIEAIFRLTGLSYLFGSPVIACFEKVSR